MSESERRMLCGVFLGQAFIFAAVTAEEIIDIVFCQNGHLVRSSAGMKFYIAVVKLILDKLSVTHGRGNVRMSQNLLNIVNIRAVFKKMGGKRMTESMWYYVKKKYKLNVNFFHS